MKKHRRRFTLSFVGFCLAFSGALQAEQITVGDIIKLKNLGYSDQEIAAEVDASGTKPAITQADVTELQKAGIGAGLISTLTAEAQGTSPQPATVVAAVPEAAPATPTAAENTPAPAPVPVPVPQPLPSKASVTPEPKAPPAAVPAISAEKEQSAAPVAAPTEQAAETGQQAPAAPAEKALSGPAADQGGEIERPRKRLRLFGSSEKTYFDGSGAMPSEGEEFVQPQISETPATPPLPTPAPTPAPRLQPVPAPTPVAPPRPAITTAQVTSHQLQAGQTAAFNLPYNNTGATEVIVTAMAPDAQWISITPTGTSAAPGSSANFQVQLSAVGLTPGSYQGSVFLTAEGATIEYPFQLRVLPGARALPQPVRPAPIPAPVPAPQSDRLTQGEYLDLIYGDHSAPVPSEMYGTPAENLVGSWIAVLPGAWGMQTVLYFELEPDGRYIYSVLQGNQLVDQSMGTLTATNNLLQVFTDEGDTEAYAYQLFSGQLYINMPEWGGNVTFYPQ